MARKSFSSSVFLLASILNCVGEDGASDERISSHPINVDLFSIISPSTLNRDDHVSCSNLRARRFLFVNQIFQFSVFFPLADVCLFFAIDFSVFSFRPICAIFPKYFRYRASDVFPQTFSSIFVSCRLNISKSCAIFYYLDRKFIV